jgi:hypothetical protein
MKRYSPAGRRNHGRPLKASGHLRPEWVNKWPNSMTDNDDDDFMLCFRKVKAFPLQAYGSQMGLGS